MVSEHFGSSLLRLATAGGGSEETMLLKAYAMGVISVAMTPRQRAWCLRDLGAAADSPEMGLDDRSLAQAVLGHRAEPQGGGRAAASRRA